MLVVGSEDVDAIQLAAFRGSDRFSPQLSSLALNPLRKGMDFVASAGVHRPPELVLRGLEQPGPPLDE